jgi:hypothetical protein
MTGTLNALKSLKHPGSPLSLGSPAKTFNPLTTLEKMSVRAGEIKSKVQSGLSSGSDVERRKKAEASVRLWIELLENQYEYEDAKSLKDAFFRTVKVPRIRLGSRTASGPSKFGAEPSSERHAQILPVGAREKSSTGADYDEKEVFAMDKYYEYIRYKLLSEDKGDLLTALMSQLYALQNVAGNETESSSLKGIIKALQELEKKQEDKEKELEAISRLKETHDETNARLDVEEDARREASNKRREAAAKAYGIINTIEKGRILEARSLVAEIQAKIRAKAGAGAGTAFGGRIYTLRAKRRNVRNKEKRRTRKGLVRQGSRPHRKTRRRA